MPEDHRKTGSQEVEAIDADIVAVLVYRDSGPGCVRVVGRAVQNIITCPENFGQRFLVFIDSAKGEKGWIYGDPKVVLYRERKDVKEEATSQRALRVEIPERRERKDVKEEATSQRALRVEIPERTRGKDVKTYGRGGTSQYNIPKVE